MFRCPSFFAYDDKNGVKDALISVSPVPSLCDVFAYTHFALAAQRLDPKLDQRRQTRDLKTTLYRC